MRIGVDLGGTKIEAIAIERDGGEIIRRRIATPRDTYENLVEVIADLVLSVEQETGKKGLVGVGMPGSISPRTGLTRNANLQILNGHPFNRDLSAKLNRTVKVENDANCFAVSEASDGAGAGEHIVFGAILGTGCGGGIVIDGHILSGVNGIAGEWGHNPLPWMTKEEWPGNQCYCGKQGCQETFISGTGFRADYQKHSGKDLSGGQITKLAMDGEPIAKAAFDRYVDRLARALASLINIIDPDVIVFGGGMSNVTALYDHVPPLLSKYTFSDGVSTPVRRAKHGDSSGVRGAAWLWSLDDMAREPA
ncbi:MAG: fructokinase [Proteobacteria bacterium]|nr:fructokinase [Alphaproteobacteria bacterium]NCC03750.1 fructokinase [Pseudomonadota bacterium]